jgi:GT2 family glycosyltransferase
VTLDVSAVVVTYNSASVIEGLLASIPPAMGELTYEIVVVDNGSTDGTRELLAARDDCILVTSGNVGYAGGINAGVKAGQVADYVLVLNPDVVLEPSCVTTLRDVMQANSRIGVIAPRMVSPSGEMQKSLRNEPTLVRALGLGFTGSPRFSEYVRDPREYASSHAADWVVGAVMLVSRRCFDEIGLDESYFLYSEETDFCLRARDRGYETWYTPDAQAQHVGGHSGRSTVTHSMQIVNRVRLYRRRHSVVPSVLYLLLAVLSEVMYLRRSDTRTYSWAAIQALLIPSRRPAQLKAGTGFLPS